MSQLKVDERAGPLPDRSQARPAQLLQVSEAGRVSEALLPEVLSQAHGGAHHRHQLHQLLHQLLHILLLGPQHWGEGTGHTF